MQVNLSDYWKPLEPIRDYVAALAEGKEKVDDFGGRKGNTYLPMATPWGWEADGFGVCDLECVPSDLLTDFAICRHTVEDLANPGSLLAFLSINSRGGYIECPSPLAEITRGVDGSDTGCRGYIHHRWFVGVKDGYLTLVPKYPIVDQMDFPLADALQHHLTDDAFQWNTYFTWEGQFKYRVLKHERDFRLDDLEEYQGIIQDLVSDTIQHNSKNWWPVIESSEKTIPGPLPEDFFRRRYAPRTSEIEEPEPRQLRVMFARFPGGGVDRAEVTDWLVRSVIAAKADPRIDSNILNWRLSDTPITMGRNQCVKVAQEQGVDILVIVDNDMHPDLYHPANTHAPLKDPRSKLFFQSSFDLLYERIQAGEGPAIVGAPYCGPPPHENVYVFQWRDFEADCPEDGARFALEQFTREEAAKMQGITEVGALPTGLMMIDMRALEYTDPPYFYYEWADETESEKASTEDVTFTRDLSLNGVPQFCNWDAWAGHFKTKCVGRPALLSPKTLNRRFTKRVHAALNIQSPDEQLVFVGGKGNGKAHQVPEYPRPTR